MRRPSYSSGFTLIELLVVIAIIGVLASMVLVSLNSAKAKARDAKRMNDLHSIQLALEMYYDKYDTYLVAGTGWGGGGQGWLAYEGGAYPKAVTRGLYEEGFLSISILEDPIQNPGYMIYLCEGEEVYAISATKENPTTRDIDYIQTTCNGVGGNGTYTRYGKNCAVANKTY